MTIPSELIAPLIWAATLAPLVWQGIKQGLSEAGIEPGAWVKFLGPRLLGLGVFVVVALGGAGLSYSNWALGGLVALFAPNLAYDLTTGALSKVAAGLAAKAAK